MLLYPGKKVRLYNVGGKWTVIRKQANGTVLIRQRPDEAPVCVPIGSIRRGWPHGK